MSRRRRKAERDKERHRDEVERRSSEEARRREEKARALERAAAAKAKALLPPRCPVCGGELVEQRCARCGATPVAARGETPLVRVAGEMFATWPAGGIALRLDGGVSLAVIAGEDTEWCGERPAIGDRVEALGEARDVFEQAEATYREVARAEHRLMATHIAAGPRAAELLDEALEEQGGAGERCVVCGAAISDLRCGRCRSTPMEPRNGERPRVRARGEVVVRRDDGFKLGLADGQVLRIVADAQTRWLAEGDASPRPSSGENVEVLGDLVVDGEDRRLVATTIALGRQAKHELDLAAAYGESPRETLGLPNDGFPPYPVEVHWDEREGQRRLHVFHRPHDVDKLNAGPYVIVAAVVLCALTWYLTFDIPHPTAHLLRYGTMGVTALLGYLVSMAIRGERELILDAHELRWCYEPVRFLPGSSAPVAEIKGVVRDGEALVAELTSGERRVLLPKATPEQLHFIEVVLNKGLRDGAGDWIEEVPESDECGRAMQNIVLGLASVPLVLVIALWIFS